MTLNRSIFALLVTSLLAAFMALMMIATASPATAAVPSAGCPEGFVEKEQNLPPGTKGAPSTSVNDSTQACFKELENAPQPLKDLIGVDTVEVVTDDVVR